MYRYFFTLKVILFVAVYELSIKSIEFSPEFTVQVSQMNSATLRLFFQKQ